MTILSRIFPFVKQAATTAEIAYSSASSHAPASTLLVCPTNSLYERVSSLPTSVFPLHSSSRPSLIQHRFYHYSSFANQSEGKSKSQLAEGAQSQNPPHEKQQWYMKAITGLAAFGLGLYISKKGLFEKHELKEIEGIISGDHVVIPNRTERELKVCKIINGPIMPSIIIERERELAAINRCFSATPVKYSSVGALKRTEDEVHAKKTKFCFLNGPSGVGKSVLAHRYAYLNQDSYDHIIFLDGENAATFQRDLDRVLREYRIDHSENLVEQLRFILTHEKNYLLVVDNIDDSEMLKAVKQLIPPYSEGHALITGRYTGTFENTISLGEISLQEGIKLFEAMLGDEELQEQFRLEPEEEKSRLIYALGRAPLAISLAANYFKSMHSYAPVSIREFSESICRERELLVDNSRILEGMGYLEGTGSTETFLTMCLKCVDHIQEGLPEEIKGCDSLVINLLRFFAFFGSSSYIPVDTDEVHKLFSALYPHLSKMALHEVLWQLRNYSLIDLQRSGSKAVVVLPQMVRWAIQLEHDRAHTQTEVEAGRLLWFRRASEYFNNITTVETIDEASITTFLSLLNELKEREYPPFLEVEFLRNSKVLGILFELASSDAKRAKQLLDTLSFEDLNPVIVKFMEIVHQSHDRQLKEETAQSILNLGILYSYSDPKKAEELVRIAIEAGQKNGYSHLYLIYNVLYENENRVEEKEAILRRQLDISEEHIKILPAPTAYYQRGTCLSRLNRLKEAVLDYREAIRLNPMEPSYYQDLSAAYLLLAQSGSPETAREKTDYLEESQSNLRIAEGLRNAPSEFSVLPGDYKQFVVSYLGARDRFNFKAQNDVLRADQGAAFAEMIKYNPTIQILNLNGCVFDDFGLSVLIRNLAFNQSIKKLSFDWNNSISDETLIELFRKAPNQLGRIEIEGLGSSPNSQNIEQSLINLGFRCIDSNPTIAKRCFRALIKLEHPDGYRYLGDYYFYLFKRERSERLFKKALGCYNKQISNSQLAENFIHRGDLYLESCHYNEALRDFFHAKKLDPYHPLPYERLAEVYAKIEGKEEPSESQRYQQAARVLRENLFNVSTLSNYSKYLILSFLLTTDYFRLYFQKGNLVDDEFWAAFGECLHLNPTIQSLTVSGAYLSDSGLVRILEGLRNPNCSIKEFKIDSGPFITDKSLKELGDFLRENRKIKSISLLECENLTYQGVLGLIVAAPKGSTIELSEYSHISRLKKDLLQVADLEEVHVKLQPSNSSWWKLIN